MTNSVDASNCRQVQSAYEPPQKGSLFISDRNLSTVDKRTGRIR